MMGGPHEVVALAKLRKRVQKASTEELSNGSVFSRGLWLHSSDYVLFTGQF